MAFSTANEGDDVVSEINITPLVDVMLVLVVALIVTAPLLSNVIKLNLPKTVATQAPEPRKPVAVSVDAQGQVYIDRTPLSLEELGPRLRSLQAAQPDLTLHLSADDAVSHGRVARVMALIEQAGITRLAVLTRVQ